MKNFFERVIECQTKMLLAKNKEERNQADRELAKLQTYKRDQMKVVK